MSAIGEDRQEAEASVGKLLGPLVDDGIESEPLEEYGKRWTSHTAAYDDDFGHLRLRGHASAYRSECRGKEGREALEDLLGGEERAGRSKGWGEPNRLVY